MGLPLVHREECNNTRLIGLENTKTQLGLKASLHRKVSQGIKQWIGKQNFSAGWPLWWMCNTDTPYPTPQPPWSLADGKRARGGAGAEAKWRTSSRVPCPSELRAQSPTLNSCLPTIAPFSNPSSISLLHRHGVYLSWSQGLQSMRDDHPGVTWRTYTNQRLWVNNQECRPWILIINSASAAEYLALAGKRKV